MSKQYEFEVTWGMIYEASSPADALRQAIGDLAEMASNPSMGPNLFVVRNMDVDPRQDIVLTAEDAVAKYWCDICDQPILEKDAENRHSTANGGDCHEACCVICPLEELS